MYGLLAFSLFLGTVSASADVECIVHLLPALSKSVAIEFTRKDFLVENFQGEVPPVSDLLGHDALAKFYFEEVVQTGHFAVVLEEGMFNGYQLYFKKSAHDFDLIAEAYSLTQSLSLTLNQSLPTCADTHQFLPQGL